MVDTTANLSILTQDIAVASENRIRIDIASEIWWSNMIAAIKLWQKGATKVSMLPNGVFRYMLEYKFPNELLLRYSEPFKPIEGRQQDRYFPAIDKLNYNNYLVAVDETLACQFKFILRD